MATAMLNDEEYFNYILEDCRNGNGSVLDIPLTDLGCNVRLFNLFFRMDVITLRDLCAFSEEEIQNIKGISKESVEFLKNKLQSAELGFRPNYLTKEKWLKDLTARHPSVELPQQNEPQESNPQPEKERTPSEQFDDLLNMPLEELNFSVRPFNYLRKAGMNVVRNLLVLSETDIKLMHGAGETVLNEVKRELASLDLELRPENMDKVIWIKAVKDDFVKSLEMGKDEGLSL